MPAVDPPFKILGTGVDRHALVASAQPLEMVVIQGFTREIEDVYQKGGPRQEDFWGKNPHLIETARKLDEILAGIQARKG
jgi:hypothetical protein